MQQQLFCLYLACFTLLTSGCEKPVLSKKEATGVLQLLYPEVIGMPVYTGDPKNIARVKAARLDSMGYVVIKQRKRLGATAAWMSFTIKANPYLLPTTEADQRQLIQYVKAGEKVLGTVLQVKTPEPGIRATVTYTTRIRVTPFGHLFNLEEGIVQQHTATLVYANRHWVWTNKLLR